MSCDTIRALVENLLRDSITVPIAYQNVPYKSVPGTSFIKCSILPVISAQKDIGSSQNLFATSGIINIGIFTVRGEGSKSGNDLATEIVNLFLRYDTGGLRCKIGYIQVVGEDESFFHINVIVPYVYEWVQ